MSEAKGAPPERGSEYTIVGVLDDGAELNQAVSDLRELGIGGEDLTVVLKRQDPDEPEPFPDGTRYIVVPDDSRGLVIPIGFAVIFVISGLFFAFTAPALGAWTFVFFIAIGAILAVGAFAKVGVDPMLIDMEVPPEDSELWNDQFENGKVLIFAITAERRLLRPIWGALQKQGADFYVIERCLKPRPVSGAILHWAGEEEGSEGRVVGAQEAQG